MFSGPTNQHDVSPETPDDENFWHYFGWVKLDTAQKTMVQSTQWGVSNMILSKVPKSFWSCIHVNSC